MMSLHTAKLCDIESYLDSLHHNHHSRPLIYRQRLFFIWEGFRNERQTSIYNQQLNFTWVDHLREVNIEATVT